MKYNRKVLNAAMPVFTMALLAGTAFPVAAEEAAATLQPGDQGYWATQEKDKISGTGYTTIATSEDGTIELQIKQKNGTVRWLNTVTGVYRDTNLSADENLAKITNAEKSDLTVSYFNGKYSELYSSYTSYDSFSMCADRGQLEYMLIDNGVRVLYTLGDNSMTYKNFPQDIENDRMQELVLQYLNDQQIAALKASYYTQLSSGKWHRMSNKDQPLGKMQVTELSKMFYEIGKYTEEELLVDLEAAGVDESEYPSNLSIVVPVEYYLDGNDLMVSLDAGAIETDEESPITQITLLPYFMTSSTTGEDEGYMFIPDGSGALINLDSTKVKEYHFAASWYGGDKLVNSSTYTSTDTKMMMPVYGMKSSDSTIMAVIENGAEVASLDAYIANTDNSEPFCKMKLTFGIQPQQRIASDSNSTYTVSKASDDIYDEDITIRYMWLEDDDTYVDMANSYRDYLIETGELAAEEPEETAPLYVEVLGTTDKVQYMLGIPYEGKQVLTSFADAKQILEDLSKAGVKNTKLIYSGMVNGGMNQRAMTGGVSFASDLGGKSGFSTLTEYAKSIGAEVFPNVLLQSAYTKKGLGGDQVAWNIVNNRGQLYEFDPVTLKVDDEADYKCYMMNPHYIGTYFDKVKNSYTSKIGTTNLASPDLMSFIGTTYTGEHVSLSTGEQLYMEAVKKLSDGMSLMMSNPIADAYAYSTYLTNLPTTDSGMRVLDASIPFMQMVLDGYKVYSCESLNEETTDIHDALMRAIESKSALKFTFTYADSALLAKTEQDDLFAVDYSYWKEQLGDIYAEYETFYEQVKDAVIVSHELYEKDDNLRIVTYSNGVQVYFNYSSQDAVIDGVDVPAFSYEIIG